MYHLNDVALPRVTEVKDLGVFLDEQLNFRQHYDRTIAKARITLGLVKRFSKEFSDQRVSKTLYRSLEYAVPVWTPYHTTHLARLESVQKQFLLFVSWRQRLPGSYALPPYRERLAVLRLDKISDRHKVACATFIFDLLMRRIDCRQLRDKIIVNTNRRGRHSRYINEAFHRTEYGRQEPLNKCIQVFNNVAEIFKSGLSRHAFRKEIIEYFRRQQ